MDKADATIMTPAQALTMLVQGASAARLTKAEHIQLEQATSVLAKMVQEGEAQDATKKAGKHNKGPRDAASDS